MKAHELDLQYLLGNTLPETGRALNVAPGIKWLRMGLPFALDHVNLWLVRDEIENDAGRRVQGWTVIDCGIDTPATRAHWQTVFVRELDGMPVLRVLVTHMHPDHVGLAHWLCERWKAPLFMSVSDYCAARLASSQGLSGTSGPHAAAFFAAHGLRDADTLAQLESRSDAYRQLVPAMPPCMHRLLDGATLAMGAGTRRSDWQLISGHGHAPEHIALYSADQGVLIAGDMVLPRISTNISVWDSEPEADALHLYLTSLDKYRRLPADTLVLPSHGKPFRGLHTRLDQLHEHHRQRLAEVLQACRSAPQCAADVLKLLFPRPLDLHQLSFALGESIAHLHWLWHAGQLRRRQDGEGIYHFSA
jgi:glyoxylase-like metal-dependent hydrolase (beta-lactamase superfamily II)